MVQQMHFVPLDIFIRASFYRFLSLFSEVPLYSPVCYLPSIISNYAVRNRSGGFPSPVIPRFYRIGENLK